MKTVLLLGAIMFSLMLAVHASTDGKCSTDDAMKGLKTDIIQNVQKLLARYFNGDKDAGTTHTTSRPRGGGHEVFVHWGRKQCSQASSLVYSGIAGGNYYHNKGGPANMLCMPEQPQYSNYTPGAQFSGQIYGTKYRDARTSPKMNNFRNHDVPCAVCEPRHQSSVLMIPARIECYPGWKRLYWGYLMSDYVDFSPSEYICVDKDPEKIPGSGKSDLHGRLLYLVESRYGSLKCPPYVNNAELTCVVCAK